MLKKLSVKNLGCFDGKEYSIDFLPETLIVGPNNSGKTMFLTGINMIKDYVINGDIRWSTDFYNLVNFEEAVNKHNRDESIEISMTIIEDSDKYDFDLTCSRDRRALRIRLNNETIPRNQRIIDLTRKLWFFRPNRSLVPYYSGIEPTGSPFQPLRPDGSNVINFMLERWTDRDKRWNQAEAWLKKIEADMTEMKTPIKGNRAYFETTFGNIPVSVSLQGSGFQTATAIIAAFVFSPEDTTLIIEEPEVFLHSDSQEVLVDLINNAVNIEKKQVIFSTHSWNILLPFFSDIGVDASRRTDDHVRANTNNFSMYTFGKKSGKVSIETYPLHQKTFRQFREDFKMVLG
jgi:predicted ATPase